MSKNLGKRRVDKLYKALFKNKSRCSYSRSNNIYYIVYNSYYFVIQFVNRRIICCFRINSWWTISGVTVCPKEFYKIYQFIESYLKYYVEADW